MRLSKFILSNIEQILQEWESFASTLLPEKNFAQTTFRDNAAEILAAIAKEMETVQSATQQAAKSKGDGPKQKTTALQKRMVAIDSAKGLIKSKGYRSSVLFEPPLFGSG